MSISRTIPLMLHANSKFAGEICAMRSAVNITAAKAEGQNNSPPRFVMDLYNGGVMEFAWSDIPVVVDLQGMIIRQDSPVFRDHRPEKLVGHTTRIHVQGSTLKVEGVISAGTEFSTEVINSSVNGFPWQASMGAEIKQVEHIGESQIVTVNNQTFEGPLLVVRKSKLMEASFVPLGADDTTIAQLIAASRSTNLPSPGTHHKEIDMKFKEWLKAQGWTDADITDLEAKKDSAVYKTLHASYEKSKEAQAEPAKNPPVPAIQATAAEIDLQARRKADADESRRVSEIRKLCAGQHSDIEAEGIEKGWPASTVELHILRASRATHTPSAGSSSQPIGQKVIEAAAMMSTGVDESIVEKSYNDQTVEAANRLSREFGGFNLTTLFLAAARSNGYTGHATRVNRQILEAAFGRLNAGFSNIDMSGILSNLANKSLLTGFMSVENGWERIADIQPATDFKTMHRYRLTGDATFEKVGNGGEIKAGSLGEQSYQNKVDTFAKMFAISRQDFINDDLSALSTVPRKIGRGGALKLNTVFWTEWLDDNSFFTSGNLNYITGATTALSIAGLSAAVTKFRRQKDADNNALGINPRILVVPPELEATALEITRSLSVNTGGSSTTSQVPNANIYQGRFEVVVSSYLTAAKVWYLLADPMDLASIEVAFLNGQRSPFVEQADADFSTLGVQMRGYYDFGVAKQEYRGALKSKGEA